MSAATLIRPSLVAENVLACRRHFRDAENSLLTTNQESDKVHTLVSA